MNDRCSICLTSISPYCNAKYTAVNVNNVNVLHFKGLPPYKRRNGGDMEERTNIKKYQICTS